MKKRSKTFFSGGDSPGAPTLELDYAAVCAIPQINRAHLRLLRYSFVCDDILAVYLNYIFGHFTQMRYFFVERNFYKDISSFVFTKFRPEKCLVSISKRVIKVYSGAYTIKLLFLIDKQ